jgi:hypothetical protein
MIQPLEHPAVGRTQPEMRREREPFEDDPKTESAIEDKGRWMPTNYLDARRSVLHRGQLRTVDCPDNSAAQDDADGGD